MADLGRKLSRADEFTEANIEHAFSSTLEEHGLKMGELAQPVRVALTGSTVSPGIHDVIAVLGKERTDCSGYNKRFPKLNREPRQLDSPIQFF